MKILKWAYEKIHKRPAPYYYDYSLIKIISKPIRKWLTNSVASRCPFNTVRIFLYRLCGFDIGKRTFIGMHCYLDDLCYRLIHIGNDVIISYGVFFACHERKQQKSVPITIEDGAYIGMRASLIGNNAVKNREGIVIGAKSVIGACTLVNRDIPPGATAVGIPCRILEEEQADHE